MQISLKRRVFRPIFLIKFDKIRMCQAIDKFLFSCPLPRSVCIATDDNRLFPPVSPRKGDRSVEQQHPDRRCWQARQTYYILQSCF